jgi:periplasmic divalent cation tolerance protein
MMYCLVLTTTSSQVEARKVACALVERKLAACVNIIPKIESIYRWQGKVESSHEWLLLIKTTARRTQAVEKAIMELHSYELPECLVIPIEGGSKGYLDWLGEQVKVPQAK